MSAWESFVRALITEGPIPQTFGLLHILSLVIMVILCVLVCIFFKKISKKAQKIILICCWASLVILEVLRQITFSYYFEGDVLICRYNWNFFPFQFCSSPLYLLPFIIFLPDGKVRRRIELFAAIFFVVGGITALIMPSFDKIQWINYQYMYHHCLMVIIGIFLALRSKEELKFKNYLQSTIVFFVLVSIALALNGIIPAIDPNATVRDGFNMYFISWHLTPKLPLIEDIYKAVPYPVYLLLYIVFFLTITTVVYILYSLCINHRVDFTLRKKKTEETPTEENKVDIKK